MSDLLSESADSAPAADAAFEPLPQLSPAAGRRLSERVAVAIRSAIESGRYNPGDRLPHENALAQQFGVSRVVVREAIKGLESQGFIQVKRGGGGGVFVRRASPRELSEALYSLLRIEGFDVSNLHEARLILEPAIAAMATERATPMAVAELERNVARAEVGLLTGQPMIASMELHSLLARMTGNPILELLMGLLSDLLETSRLLHASPIDSSPQAGRQVVDDHKAIVDAVANHDPELVRRLMLQHLGRISTIESSAQ